jgi:hypothetical protein
MDAYGNLTLRYWNDLWMTHTGSHWAEREDESIRDWFYRRTERAVYVNAAKMEIQPRELHHVILAGAGVHSTLRNGPITHPPVTLTLGIWFGTLCSLDPSLNGAA